MIRFFLLTRKCRNGRRARFRFLCSQGRVGSSPIFRIIKETSGDSPEVFFYCTEAIPEPRVQVFAPLRSAQSTRPPDELRPIFRIIKETSDDLLKVFFYCTEAIPESRVQVFAPLRSVQSTRPPDDLRPIFRTDVLN